MFIIWSRVSFGGRRWLTWTIPSVSYRPKDIHVAQRILISPVVSGVCVWGSRHLACRMRAVGPYVYSPSSFLLFPLSGTLSTPHPKPFLPTSSHLSSIAAHFILTFFSLLSSVNLPISIFFPKSVISSLSPPLPSSSRSLLSTPESLLPRLLLLNGSGTEHRVDSSFYGLYIISMFILLVQV